MPPVTWLHKDLRQTPTAQMLSLRESTGQSCGELISESPCRRGREQPGLPSCCQVAV